MYKYHAVRRTDLDPVVSLVGPGGAVQVGAGAGVGAEAGAGPGAVRGLVVLVIVRSPATDAYKQSDCDMMSLTPSGCLRHSSELQNVWEKNK